MAFSNIREFASSRPFYHAFIRAGTCHIYDVNKNFVLEVPEQVYQLLREIEHCERAQLNRPIVNNPIEVENEEKNESLNWINQAYNGGFLSNHRPLAIVNPYDFVFDELIDSALNTICLQITQQCNLRCKYCVYSGIYDNRVHSNREMDLSIAKMALQYLLKHSSQSNDLNIGFYGGEPLLRFDFIEDCIRHSVEIAEGKPINFNLTTNGTLLDRRMFHFFEKYNVDIAISIDGPKEVHDRNRCFPSGEGTFRKVSESISLALSDFPNYARTHILYSIVDCGSGCLDKVIKFFGYAKAISQVRMSHLSYIETDLLKERGTFEPTFQNHVRDANVMNQEYFKHLLYKAGKISKRHVSEVLSPTVGLDFEQFLNVLTPRSEQLPERMHPGGPCQVGRRRLFVDVDGNLFPCERLSETCEECKIGTVFTGIDTEKGRKLLNVGQSTADKCMDCWAMRLCTLCAKGSIRNGILSRDQRLSGCERVKRRAETVLGNYAVSKRLRLI
jgi:uncharacterized protein